MRIKTLIILVLIYSFVNPIFSQNEIEIKGNDTLSKYFYRETTDSEKNVRGYQIYKQTSEQEEMIWNCSVCRTHFEIFNAIEYYALDNSFSILMSGILGLKLSILKKENHEWKFYDARTLLNYEESLDITKAKLLGYNKALVIDNNEMHSRIFTILNKQELLIEEELKIVKKGNIKIKKRRSKVKF